MVDCRGSERKFTVRWRKTLDNSHSVLQNSANEEAGGGRIRHNRRKVQPLRCERGVEAGDGVLLTAPALGTSVELERAIRARDGAGAAATSFLDEVEAEAAWFVAAQLRASLFGHPRLARDVVVGNVRA